MRRWNATVIRVPSHPNRFGLTTREAVQSLEIVMTRISALLSVLLVAASTSAFAQTMQKAPSPTTQNGATANQAADSASSGASTSGGPTLMQQREKGMSPDGASGADANGKTTGKIKQ